MGQSQRLQNNMSTASHFGTPCPVNGAQLEDWPRGLSWKPPTQPAPKGPDNAAGAQGRAPGTGALRSSTRSQCVRLPWVFV